MSDHDTECDVRTGTQCTKWTVNTVRHLLKSAHLKATVPAAADWMSRVTAAGQRDGHAGTRAASKQLIDRADPRVVIEMLTLAIGMLHHLVVSEMLTLLEPGTKEPVNTRNTAMEVLTDQVRRIVDMEHREDQQSERDRIGTVLEDVTAMLNLDTDELVTNSPLRDRITALPHTERKSMLMDIIGYVLVLCSHEAQHQGPVIAEHTAPLN